MSTMETGTGVSAAEQAAAAAGVRVSPRLVAFDLDGVIWRGDEILPGVRAALQHVVGRGLELRYVSNNSTAHRRTVSERLLRSGLPAGVDRVLTSGFVTARWLGARLPAGAPILVVGESGLVEELTDAGLNAYHAGNPPAGPVPAAAVVVGMDRAIDFAILAAAQKAVRAGALFVATNRDATFPTCEGEVPGAGCIVAAVATAAEREPILMGKPSLALAEVLASTTGISAAETVFVGDRLSTDIVMGKAAGMITVLVLTGVTTAGELYGLSAPKEGQSTGAGHDLPAGTAPEGVLHDHVLADLTGLPALLGRLAG